MNAKALPILSLLVLSFHIHVIHAEETMSYEEAEALFNADFEEDLPKVNRGELTILETPPGGDHLRISNIITIRDTSLDDGWVDLQQCHDNIEAFPRAEIVYAYEGMKDLQVVSSQGIKVAKAKKKSVDLTEVEKGARLCVSAQVRILRKQQDGRYQLKNGPFYRRFLDGYYPLFVELQILYPDKHLRFNTSRPEKKRGIEVAEEKGSLILRAWFEGELTFEVYWHKKIIH